MADLVQRWNRKAAAVALLTIVAWISIGFSIALVRWNSIQQPCPRDLEAEILQARCADPEVTREVSEVLVHLYVIEFTVTSSDAHTIQKDFASRFETALSEFNADSTRRSRNFLTSDTLAALFKAFAAKGEFTIRDEVPRIIPTDQTDEWGSNLSISARPSIDSAGHVLTSLDVASDRFRIQSSIAIRSGTSFSLSSAGGCFTSPQYLRVPMLCELPNIGEWFMLPIGQKKTGHFKQVIFSATVLPNRGKHRVPESAIAERSPDDGLTSSPATEPDNAP